MRVTSSAVVVFLCAALFNELILKHAVSALVPPSSFVAGQATHPYHRLSGPEISKGSSEYPYAFSCKMTNQKSTEIDSLLPARQSAIQDTPVPTGRKILDLAIPAAAALLIDPLMTLADTAFVGRFSYSADPLAGMGSAAALLTFSFYLFNFLCTASTPLISSQRASGQESKAFALAGQVLSLALSLGVMLTVALWTFRQPLLNVMGTGITGNEANGYAMAFLGVRALAAPAVLCIEASTGILRGYLDTKTPIVILVVANVVNLFLDIVLIAMARMGPMGAAIATTSAEWISAFLFLLILAGRLPSAGGLLGSNRKLEDGTDVSVTPAFAMPPLDEVRPLLVASGSVFLRTLILQLSLSSAAAMAARSGQSLETGAAAAVAAHQIGIQIWLLGSFLCDSLAAASQTLIADAIGRVEVNAVRDITKTVFNYSLVLGAVLGGLLLLADSSMWLYDIFTNNEATRLALSQIVPLIIAAQPLNALVFAADGVIQGASEFIFQAKAMMISGIMALSTFLVLQSTSANTDTLFHVWCALLALQSMRGLTSLWKIVDKNGPIDLLSLNR